MEMILQDRTLPLTQQQRQIVALVVRYHRKGLPKDDHLLYSKLSASDRKKVNLLGGILRIADGLDRSHLSCVNDVEAEIGLEKIVFRCKTTGSANPEMWAAQKKSDLLHQALAMSVAFKC
jgi:exopolyphosphatase/guanosine-5'-triphosphate,3'-diphosphate pyrophosphatase